MVLALCVHSRRRYNRYCVFNNKNPDLPHVTCIYLQDDAIKYVLSVYAQEKFFHMHLRQTVEGTYVIGLEKAIEKDFPSPIHCVDYYRHHNLRCINSLGNVVVTLKPICE